MTNNNSESLPSEITLKKHYGDFKVQPGALIVLQTILNGKDPDLKQAQIYTPDPPIYQGRNWSSTEDMWPEKEEV